MSVDTDRILEFEVGGMTCLGCAAHVRRKLEAVPDVAAADVSLEEQCAAVRAVGSATSEDLMAAVEEAGYDVRLLHSSTAGPADELESRAGSTEGSQVHPVDGGRHLLVIGGGSAAFAAAIRAAELNAQVTMVERDQMGGTCVNRGCVPSKTLIRAAQLHHHRRNVPFDGLPSGDGNVDMKRLTEQKRELLTRLRNAKYRDVLSSYPEVEYVDAEARFAEADELEVALSVAGGGVRRDSNDRIVIATGARPWIPDLAGLEDLGDGRVWTNESALAADEVPDRLVVAGAGPVGVELAQLFSRLGSRVTLVAPELLPPADADLAESLAGHLREEGLEVVSPARLRAVESPDRNSSSNVAVAEVEDDGQKRFPFDRLLLATGRTANTDALDVEKVGLETTGRGFFSVDDRLRTSHPGVFAAGDCTDGPHFVNVAAKAGTVAAENALGGDRRLDLSALPVVVFTEPQLAWAGLTEGEARQRHGASAVEVRTLPMAEVPRALANRDTRGRIKIVADADDGHLLGIHVLSPRAGEVIQTAVLALKVGLAVDDLADTLFPYLTEVEGLRLAAQTFTRSVDNLSCCAG